MLTFKNKQPLPNQCEIGDSRVVLPRWARTGFKVDMAITSPPYYNLRDYHTGQWKGGDKKCEHLEKIRLEGITTTVRVGGVLKKAITENTVKYGRRSKPDKVFFKNKCPHCGAVRVDNQIGRENTPTAFISNLVEVFRHVKSVLKDDGTVWINIGDSYNSLPKQVESVKPKELFLIPQRLILALQADGWYARQIIIWAKAISGRIQAGACKPEPSIDRCATSHEYLFLLSKRPNYYFDADSIKERISKAYADDTREPGILRQKFYSNSKYVKDGLIKQDKDLSKIKEKRKENLMRGRRSVWLEYATGYRGAHTAVFPPRLIAPCIQAGSKPGGRVLDMFFGSGTTGEVCNELGREWYGIDLNGDFKQLQKERTENRLNFK